MKPLNKIIYIEASPRKERSHSIALATQFLADIQTANPDVEIDRMDLWAKDLPAFNGALIDAKYALLNGEDPSSDQARAWKSVTQVIDRIADADLIVISTPMWNFGVPYVLKHLIDIIAQPGYTYQPRADAPYENWGLLSGKSAVVITARGGTVAPGTGVEDWDFQARYLDYALKFIGIRDVTQVAVELTAVDKEHLPDRQAAAAQTLSQLATRLTKAVAASVAA
ncbi:NAD(P)H-dependent oxidoreductase [uncultured Roseobacter sp.]|uniref:FMN-dependent NADH-azoreductase n=1 Tax=uncultured Roseobacter sp. TaxID=114847 RepID=UPI002605E6A1|nr:NAD(P)H-dependent oxidoreductase [uncultured Roseobacter sp.]